jgi:hypothetical protein
VRELPRWRLASASLFPPRWRPASACITRAIGLSALASFPLGQRSPSFLLRRRRTSWRMRTEWSGGKWIFGSTTSANARNEDTTPPRLATRPQRPPQRVLTLFRTPPLLPRTPWALVVHTTQPPTGHAVTPGHTSPLPRPLAPRHSWTPPPRPPSTFPFTRRPKTPVPSPLPTPSSPSPPSEPPLSMPCTRQRRTCRRH